MNEATTTLSYLWQVPGKRVSVHVSLDVIDHLGLAVMEGFQSLPRRGLETGGLLLGRARRSGEAIVVDIDDFEPLECEHAVGPSYLLSASDRAVLEERIRRHKSIGGLSLVGFYRSHTRKDFAVTVEDVDFMSAYFPEPSNVFLLIHAHRDGPPTAGFAIWEGRKIRSMTPYLEFPFRRAILMARAEHISSRTCATQPAREQRTETRRSPAFPQTARLRAAASRLLRRPHLPVALGFLLRRPGLAIAVPGVLQRRQFPRIVASLLRRPEVPEVLSRFLRQRRMRLRMEWLAAAILVVGVLAGILSLGMVPTVASVPLGLRAAREGSSVRLLWDRSAPVVRTATRAILWIGDGRAQTKLDIDPKQLSGGSIVYWPRSRDITFRMEIFAPNLFGSESLATAVMHQKPPDASPATLKVAESTTPAPASAIAVPSPETPPITPPRRAPFQKKHYRALPELSAVSASPAMPLFPDPPEIASGPVSDPEALLFSESDILKTRLPEISDPFVSVTIDPLSESRRGGLLGKLPLIGKRHKPSGFVPPTPVHEAPTNVPPEVRHRTKHEVPIDVKLYVDRAGKVEYVELLSKKTGPDRDLASLAVLSSRRWQFAPARLGDESVPAEVVLRFRFGPEVH